uniref:Uncharacterized protein n=1 Tax=Oryza glumipatula TaxID=40148 RepID=A0A0E0B7V0_9ORYZ
MWYAAGTGLVPTRSPPLSVPSSSPAFAAPQSFAAHLNTLPELQDMAAESKHNKKLLAAVPAQWSDGYRNYPFSADGGTGDA